jgi:hypothetical protein
MSDCPACSGYSSSIERQLDAAGRDHVAAMARIREREAAGLEVMQLTRISPAVIGEAARTADLLGFASS